MKITRKELDQSILNKLDQFDRIKETYDGSSDGFVSFGPNGFFFKKTNDTFLKKIYTEDEFIQLEEGLYKEKRNITSSLLTDIRLDNKYNAACRRFIHNVKFTASEKFPADIILKEKLSNSFIFLTANGTIVKLGANKRDEVDILSLIKSHFNLSTQFSVYSFVDICEIDEDNIIIATNDFGIYKFTFSTKTVELICALTSVKSIEYSHTKTLFVATNDFCAQYDIPTGKRIEKYSMLVNERHIPKKIIKSDYGMFILGIPAGVQNIDTLLHFWKLDGECLGYNCADDYVRQHSFDNAYQILDYFIDDTYIYLTGKLGNHRLFVWKYNLITLDLEENILDCIDITTYDGFIAVNNKYAVLNKNNLYIIENNELISHITLDHECQGLQLLNGEIYTTYKNQLFKFELPKFTKAAENLSFKVFDGVEPCNNIDIFVKGATRSERISLIDMDTNKEILSSFYMVYNNDSIIKLLNCKSTKIKMIISVGENTKLDGIAIKNNRMFLR